MDIKMKVQLCEAMESLDCILIIHRTADFGLYVCLDVLLALQLY